MLHIHRSERADGLVEALGELLAKPLADPFAREVVSVPTRGMERWLTQRMSSVLGATPGASDGICANVDFPSPRRLVGDAVATASGIDPDTDPWLPERAVWPLLEVVDAAMGEDWLHVLAAHLGQGSDDETLRARRFASVRHMADLFDRYALHRPGLVRAWAAGEDNDASGKPLRDDCVWQAELWRRLRDRIAEPDPAERLAGACARLRDESDLVDLPSRLGLFGLTRLPAGRLHVLRALAEHRDVHLFLLHPSPALWSKVAERIGSWEGVSTRRADDPTATITDNRLLASWGHDSREMQLVVAGGPEHVDDHRPTAVGGSPDTLLARIQEDIRADRPAPGAPVGDASDERPLLDPDDRSIQVHSCHGRARQVEVVRDAILHLLAADPALEPRDVIVMCPDIETFAPLIQATFGAGEIATDDDDLDALPEDRRPPDLRVRLADRSLRQTNPILGVVGRLIDLAEQRLTASQVIDLADREPVRRRFRFDDDDLARVEEWVTASGIRWGLDAEHRAPFKLESLASGTWRAGLDRVLLGVTMTDAHDRLFGGVLPLDDVESGAIDLAGRFAELVDRLGAALDALSKPQTIDDWADAIGAAADALTSTSPRDAWQRAELQRILDDVVAEATSGGGVHSASLVLPEVRALLAERLQGRPTRANFRTGHLTICTLVPMRSVPHRVVCLLGLDDSVFPRKGVRDGDDLTLEDPHVGDRDTRTEDRQLLLDALLAAKDHLVVTYTGNDERTNVRRPPAVPVGELLDAVDRTARTAAGGDARDQVLVRHPLQPFDPANFTPGKLGRPADQPWSFDRVTLDGALALTGERSDPPPFLSGPLEDTRGELIEVDSLVKFSDHPVRAFLRQRLEVSVGDFFEDVDDALSVELDNLEEWQIGDRLLGACLGGADIDDAVAAESARGMLPPGELAKPVIAKVKPIAERILEGARLRFGELGTAESIDVKVRLPDGRTLSGAVPGVCGDVVRTVTYSRVGAKHRLTAWVRLLALTAAYPDREFIADTLGRAVFGAGRGMQVTLARLPALGDSADQRHERAVAELTKLIGIYDQGLCEPLPIACKTTAAYANALHQFGDPVRAAEKEWKSDYAFPREDKDLEHQLVFGGVIPLADLLAVPPTEEESGDGWDESESSRFGRYAVRLWGGLLACEQVRHK